MPLSSTKRDAALLELDHALTSLGRAISLLGGKTRSRVPRNAPHIFTARQMIESCSTRLSAAARLLTEGFSFQWDDPPKLSEAEINAKIEAAQRAFVPGKRRPTHDVQLRDAFEREYDSTRNPGC